MLNKIVQFIQKVDKLDHLLDWSALEWIAQSGVCLEMTIFQKVSIK